MAKKPFFGDEGALLNASTLLMKNDKPKIAKINRSKSGTTLRRGKAATTATKPAPRRK